MAKRLRSSADITKKIKEVPFGTLVYRPYIAKTPGIVINDLGYRTCFNPTMHSRWVRVKWLDGKENNHDVSRLQDFEALIEDHRKKLNNHLKRKEEIENMSP